jgi:hypothetical protein
MEKEKLLLELRSPLATKVFSSRLFWAELWCN